MKSPTHAAQLEKEEAQQPLPLTDESEEVKANVDNESIAFGVMYCPRQRIQRTMGFNYNNRQVREGSFFPTFIQAPSGSQGDHFGLGFVSETEWVRDISQDMGRFVRCPYFSNLFVTAYLSWVYLCATPPGSLCNPVIF